MGSAFLGFLRGACRTRSIEQAALHGSQVRALESLHPLEERLPVLGAVEPAVPARIELLFRGLGKPPERDAAGRLEDLGTAVRGGSEDGARRGQTDAYAETLF